MKNTVKLLGVHCTLEFGYYDNNTVSIHAYRARKGAFMWVATINYEDQYQGSNYKKECGYPNIIIKNYDDNEGIYKDLKDAGVITTGPYLSGSGGTVQVGVLTPKWQAIAKEQLSKIE